MPKQPRTTKCRYVCWRPRSGRRVIRYACPPMHRPCAGAPYLLSTIRRCREFLTSPTGLCGFSKKNLDYCIIFCSYISTSLEFNTSIDIDIRSLLESNTDQGKRLAWRLLTSTWALYVLKIYGSSLRSTKVSARTLHNWYKIYFKSTSTWQW